MTTKQFNLYNPDRKMKFLEEEYPNEATRTTYKSLLSIISVYENEKDKDLCDFSYADAVELLIGLRRKSLQSLNVAHTVIVKYTDWCIDPNQFYSKTGFNAFKLIRPEEKEKYVHQIAVKKSYFTREEIFGEVINQLYNYIDKAIIALIFEGVRGRSENGYSFEELRNLKKKDIMPESNQVVVTRYDEDYIEQKRVVEVSPETMSILVKAREEEEYHKDNGNASGKLAILPLRDNDYLIRTIANNWFGDDERATINSIHTRFKAIREYTGVKFLNATLVFQSGLLEKCEKLEEIKGELTTQDYRDIYLNMELSDSQYATLKSKYELFKKNKSSR